MHRIKGLPILQLGAVIRLVRQTKGMKLTDLARASGLSIPFLSLVETGKRDASLETLRRISAALDIPSETLVLLGMSDTDSQLSADERSEGLAATIHRLAEAEERLRAALEDEPADEAE